MKRVLLMLDARDGLRLKTEGSWSRTGNEAAIMPMFCSRLMIRLEPGDNLVGQRHLLLDLPSPGSDECLRPWLAVRTCETFKALVGRASLHTTEIVATVLDEHRSGNSAAGGAVSERQMCLSVI